MRIQSCPKETDPWSRVHMGHENIKGMGLFLTIVVTFSGWPEVVKD